MFFGDFVALLIPYFMSKISSKTTTLKTLYPPYLSMGLIFLFNCINMIFSAYFFDGKFKNL